MPLDAHSNFVSPGWIFLSRNLIRSLNKPRSSCDNAAMILQIKYDNIDTTPKKET